MDKSAAIQGAYERKSTCEMSSVMVYNTKGEVALVVIYLYDVEISLAAGNLPPDFSSLVNVLAQSDINTFNQWTNENTEHTEHDKMSLGTFTIVE